MAAHVLVADDDPHILTMLSEVLKKKGYTFDLAKDGAEALAQAKQKAPDVLVTDVMMPKLDGWSLVRELRADPNLAKLPVIFLTALAANDDRLRAFRLGADDYINKPFRFDDLVARIEKLLARPADVAVRVASAGLNGDLSQVGLSTLLVLVEMERKTGLLQMKSSDGRAAKLLLRDGKIVDAQIDGTQTAGAACVYQLLTWTTGKFQFTAKTVDGPDRVQLSTTHLLMEGARRMDEAGVPEAKSNNDAFLGDEAVAEWEDDQRTPMIVAAKLAELVRRTARASLPPAPFQPVAVAVPVPAPGPPPRSESAPEPRKPTLPRRTTWPYLALGIVAGLAGAALIVVPVDSAATADATRLKAEAAALATTLDHAADMARTRADGFAALPMLRAGIETDAATLQDMANTEALFKPAPGEIIEVFLASRESMLRLPASAPPIDPPRGSETAARSNSGMLEVLASAPITSQGGVAAGIVAVAEPVDVAAAKRSLSAYTRTAKLAGLAAPLVLGTSPPGPSAVSIAVPSKLATKLSLVADLANPPPSWLLPARIACFALATALLLVFVALRARQ